MLNPDPDMDKKLATMPNLNPEKHHYRSTALRVRYGILTPGSGGSGPMVGSPPGIHSVLSEETNPDFNTEHKISCNKDDETTKNNTAS
jgi:hypothetical protein